MDLDAGTTTVPVAKNGDAKVMIVTGTVLEMLKARCDGLEPASLLFPGRKASTPLDPKKSWRKLVTAAQLPEDCSFHWLRKTAATRLLRAGVDVASVAAVTGTPNARSATAALRERRSCPSAGGDRPARRPAAGVERIPSRSAVADTSQLSDALRAARALAPGTIC